jgi:hypothetical protein
MTQPPYQQQQPGQQWYMPQHPQQPGQAPQYGQPYPGPQYEPPRRRKSWPRRHWFLTFFLFPFLALVLIIIIAVAASGGGTSGGGSGGGTVTYIVTGSNADVTYGPAGSDAAGKVPMHVTKTIPGTAPDYYAISAQLQGSGTVKCEIEVNGKVISTGTATGSYNIASCEITPGLLPGHWDDTNKS